jgi:flagellar hook assembly protein FlgD
MQIYAHPNPFSNTVKIELEGKQPAQLEIYNLRGQRVRSFEAQLLETGRLSAEWDGLDEAGIRVSSGIYFLRVNQSGQVQMKKLILLR